MRPITSLASLAPVTASAILASAAMPLAAVAAEAEPGADLTWLWILFVAAAGALVLYWLGKRRERLERMRGR